MDSEYIEVISEEQLNEKLFSYNDILDIIYDVYYLSDMEEKLFELLIEKFKENTMEVK